MYRLGQLSGCPLSSLYRAYRTGLRDGDKILHEARKNLILYKGEWVSLAKAARDLGVSASKLSRRIEAGLPVGCSTKEARGCNQETKLTPSQVLEIYNILFRKQKTQSALAKEFSVHQSTISDVWRHKRWVWLTSPIRYELENE